MAVLDTFRPARGLSVGGRLAMIFTNVSADIAGFFATRATRNALEKLSDRELADIGLNRGDIDEIRAHPRR